MKNQILKAKKWLKSKKAFAVDTAIKVLTAVVLGALVLTCLYGVINKIVLPNAKIKIDSLYAITETGIKNEDGSFEGGSGIEEKKVCTIVGTNKYFNNIMDAVKIATNGQTILLTKNHNEGNIVISEGQNLDLNGKNLNLESIVTNKNSNIIDTAEIKGILKISNKNNTIINKDNSYIVMWDKDGYIFGKPTMNQKIVNLGNNKFKFILQPLFESKKMSTNYFFDGVENNNIKLGVYWELISDNGKVKSTEEIFTDNDIKHAYPNTGIKALNLTFSNLKSGTTIKMHFFIKSNDFNVYIKGKDISYVIK